MKESAEKVIKVGFSRDPKRIFNEVEQVSAEMIRSGWTLANTVLEESLECIHLFFEREIPGDPAP